MKKILSLGLTLALFAGGMTLGSAPFVSATAETEDIIQPMALYEFENETKPGQDTSGNGFDLKLLNTSQNGDEAIQIKENMSPLSVTVMPRTKAEKRELVYMLRNLAIPEWIFPTSSESPIQCLLLSAGITLNIRAIIICLR